MLPAALIGIGAGGEFGVAPCLLRRYFGMAIPAMLETTNQRLGRDEVA